MIKLSNFLILMAFFIISACSGSNMNARINHLILKGDQIAALALIDEKIEQNDEDHSLYYQKSKLYFSVKKYREAIEAINLALSLEPGIPEYRIQAGKNYYFIENYYNAINHFKAAILLDSEIIESYYYLSLAYYKSGKIDASKKYLKIVIDIEPLYFDALLLRSELNYKKNQTDDEAVAQILDLNNILKLNPQSIKGTILLSNLYFQIGNSLKSKKVIEDLLKQKTNNAILIQYLASNYLKSGLYKQAHELIKQFREKNKTIDILTLQIKYHTNRDTKFDRELHKLISKFPNDAELRFIQGLTFFDQKKYIKAESSFQKVLSIKPDSAKSYFYLSKISEFQKDIYSEKFYLEKAFGKAPQNNEILSSYMEMVLNSGDMTELENLINKYDSELTNAFSKFYQAIIYKVKGDATAARSILNGLSENEYSLRVETQLADMEIEEGHYQSAEKRLNLVLDASPSLLDAILIKAKLLFRSQKINEVIAFLKPHEINLNAKGAIHLLLSEALIQVDQVDTAIKILNSGLGTWPEHVEIAQMLSVLLEAKGQNQAAIQVLSPLQNFEHKFNQLFHYRLIGLYLKTKQKQKMRDYLQRFNIKKELRYQNNYLKNFIFKHLNTCNKPKEKAD